MHQILCFGVLIRSADNKTILTSTHNIGFVRELNDLDCHNSFSSAALTMYHLRYANMLLVVSTFYAFFPVNTGSKSISHRQMKEAGKDTFTFHLNSTKSIGKGNEQVFNPFPNKPLFLCVCSKSLLKVLWKKEKLLIMSNFSFSHSVLYRF